MHHVHGFSMKAVFLFILLAVVHSHSARGANIEAQQHESNRSSQRLFLDTGTYEKKSLDQREILEKDSSEPIMASLEKAKQWKTVSLNPAILGEGAVVSGSQLAVSLFEKEVIVRISSVKTDVNGVTSLAGEIVGDQLGQAYLMIKGDDFFAYFELPQSGREFQVNSTRLRTENDFVVLQEVDVQNKDVVESKQQHTQVYLKDHAATSNRVKPPLPQQDGQKDHQHTDRVRQKINSDNSDLGEAEIELLVVYTNNAVRRLELDGLSIDFAIATAIERTNIALKNSGVRARVTLVGSKVIDYSEQGSCSEMLRDLKESTNGLDSIAEWRDEAQADIVSLFADFDNKCGGLAYPLDNHPDDWPYDKFKSTTFTWRAESAFNLIRIAQAHNSYTFAHEFGHNLGAGHHAEQNKHPGPTGWRLYDYDLKEWYTDPDRRYSAGWRWSDLTYIEACCVTIMSYQGGEYYADGEDKVRVPYYSSPRVSTNQFPTGNASLADNARTLNETAQLVSKYDQILGLSGNRQLPLVSLQGALSGSWYDPQRNGEGFFLEFAENASDDLVTVFWFTYQEGRPYWLFDAQPYSSSDEKIRFKLNEANGPSFGASFDSSQLSIDPWGEIEFEFLSCTKAVANWRSQNGQAGSFKLERITSKIAQTTCLD